MKILFCKTAFAGPISGADEIAVMYAVELKRAGHSPAVLLVRPPAPDDPLLERLREAIKAIRAFSPTSKLILSKSRNLMFELMQRYHQSCCEYLERERPDVVHVLTPDQGAMMLIRAAHTTGLPVVYQEVGLPFHPPGFEEVYQRFTSVLPLCTKVAVLSPGLSLETSRALPQLQSQPTVLPLISHDATNGANSLRPQAGPLRFGFASRLEYLKGPLQLVTAFAQLHASQPNIELRIAGEGSQRQEIVGTLKTLGLEKKCKFTGVYTTVSERAHFMHDIDVFVLPSLTEGTPNAIIEAMAHGKPVVASKVGGIPDLVDENVGILFPPGDVKSLEHAMAKLAGDAELRKKMGHAARRTYEQLFTSAAVLPMLTNFYQRVMDHHHASGNGRNHSSPATHPWALFNE
jgi:glycosyltransferase involved in cell wall biosynthesis